MGNGEGDGGAPNRNSPAQCARLGCLSGEERWLEPVGMRGIGRGRHLVSRRCQRCFLRSKYF